MICIGRSNLGRIRVTKITCIIAKAEQVCKDYTVQGFDLTLRQIYYQFVSRVWISNNDVEYEKVRT